MSQRDQMPSDNGRGDLSDVSFLDRFKEFRATSFAVEHKTSVVAFDHLLELAVRSEEHGRALGRLQLLGRRLAAVAAWPKCALGLVAGQGLAQGGGE